VAVRASMRRLALTLVLVATVALAGCAGLGGDADDAAVPDDPVVSEDAAAGATGVNHTLRVRADETTAGQELTAVGATYPREAFAVDSAQHEAIRVGVDTDGDGTLDREFDESDISGVNNNAFSFTVTLDTDYTLQAGDVVVVRYPAVDNPTDPGEYDVEISLNDAQTASATLSID